MNGHKREDVVKYQQEKFLSRVQEFERRMVKYVFDPSGKGMIKVIGLFQDKSCYQVNEHSLSAWLSEYWGWVKYWYRQVPKTNFEQAKTAAINAFDACPVNVICQFINWSWHFMSAYCIGLTGKAAAWAVHKQKGHCAVSQSMMMLLDAIVNQNNGN
ncbi:hypothetical protein AN958_06864 [Leucoagaricus sp. SymC.cos]|nr:hypothetical protein AN958_06864 [Leucoagaricus sp. SymC.cos]